MVGYIEDLELINVTDILSDVSLNNSTLSPSDRSSSTPTREGQQFSSGSNIKQEHENAEKLNDTIQDNFDGIPNPVGFLQEMCVKRGLTSPVYGVLKQDGPSHHPTFWIFCQVDEYYREVSANSKKKAKEMAAREIIMCVKNHVNVAVKSEPEQNIESENTAVTSEYSKPSSTRSMNFVGFLQELCVRKHLPPPNYGIENSTGTPNNPCFYIFCEVGPLKEIGIGSNKKNAKQLAAEKVLQHLEMLKTETESFYKDTTHAENNEILQNPTTTKLIQKLSEMPLEPYPFIPNPVGHLQELCVKNRLRPPVYETIKVDGPDHCPTFVTTCKVEYFYQEASSSNKKKGKELAAAKILKSLMEYRSTSKQ